MPLDLADVEIAQFTGESKQEIRLRIFFIFRACAAAQVGAAGFEHLCKAFGFAQRIGTFQQFEQGFGLELEGAMRQQVKLGGN